MKSYWLNGRFCDDPLGIDVRDRGLLLGDGLFETIYLENGRPAFLSDHLARIRASLTSISIEISLPETLELVLLELCKAHGLEKGPAAARLTVTRGVGARGLAFPDAAYSQANVIVTVSSTASPPKEAQIFLSTIQRAEGSFTARHKTLCYLDNVMAYQEASEAGAFEAIMMNAKGRVAGGARSNIFCINDDGAVLTPSLEEGALGGIVRGRVISQMNVHGVKIAEGPIAISALKHAYVLLSNSLIGLVAARLPNCPAPNTMQQDIVARLQSWYREDLLRNIKSSAAS